MTLVFAFSSDTFKAVVTLTFSLQLHWVIVFHSKYFNPLILIWKSFYNISLISKKRSCHILFYVVLGHLLYTREIPSMRQLKGNLCTWKVSTARMDFTIARLELTNALSTWNVINIIICIAFITVTYRSRRIAICISRALGTNSTGYADLSLCTNYKCLKQLIVKDELCYGLPIVIFFVPILFSSSHCTFMIFIPSSKQNT